MKKCQTRSLTPFLDGELTEDAWQETEEHLQSCPSCSAQLDELTAASQHVGGMGRAHIPQQALRAAINIIAPRAGLTAEAMLAETTEIARAQPAAPPIPSLPGMLGPAAPVSEEQEWTPAPMEAAEAPELLADLLELGTEIPEPAAEIPEPAAEISEPAAEVPELAAEIPEPVADAEPSPTWVQPEPWVHPEAPEPSAAGAQDAAPEAPAAAAPEPPPVVPPPEEVTEVASVDVMPVLEEHPPAPPGLIVPAWMDGLPVSKTQLELGGRQAVDDAIGPAATRLPATEAAAHGLVVS